MKSVRWFAVLVCLVFVAACSDNPGHDSLSDSDSSTLQSYSEDLRSYGERLRQEKKTLLDSSWELQRAAQEAAEASVNFDRVLQAYLTLADAFPKASVLEPAYKLCVDQLDSLEAVLIKSLQELHDNAAQVYQDVDGQQKEIAKWQELFANQGNKLTGMRRLLESHYTNLLKSAQKKEEPAVSSTSTPSPYVPSHRVTLTPEETRVAATSSSQAVTRDDSGRTGTLGQSEILNYAQTNGYSVAGAEDAFRMSSQTGGLMGFAAGKTQLARSITDMIAHMKSKMNSNSDGLELVFVLDYSGSMSDDIEGVIKGLLTITESLRSVRTAGRSVKIGIVTFGYPGREKVEVDLTSNLVTITQELQRLLSEYPSRQHSTDPGESSYHGLEATASRIGWSSRNRMALLITDEEAHEAHNSTYGQPYMDRVMRLLDAQGIQIALYPILVKPGY